MGYFTDSYNHFRYPIKSDEAPGLRTAQLGAIHAAASHFANRTDPGIITMPTGSGKTAVLMASAFVLRAQRVLVITPSRLVREQIAEEFGTLKTLKVADAIPQDFGCPRVTSTRKKITSSEEWETMRDFDVVVATIQSISPELVDIPEPPADLFDLVLVDEAHHSPARTWQAVLDHFSSSKRLLFTATPFRQDQREIKGRFIYTYDLHTAYRDGIFGQISFQPVTPLQDQSHDEAIARAVEGQFQTDVAAGYQHRIMVRTDGLRRAHDLLELYRRCTNLKLSIVTGNHSLRYVKTVISQLQAGDLDGIVCVNMFGEGFNFPALKIAAIHAPHKSLNVTLQFVGRFARTVGENLGPATFLAVPSDVEIETERLYDARAVWQDMIQNLAALRVDQEAETREVLQSFETIDHTADLSDLSLYSLEPYYHVMVYQLDEEIDVQIPINIPQRFQIVYQAVSGENSSAVYVTRQITQPRWVDDERLANVESDLFIFYFDVDTKLLFICSSKRAAGLYCELIASFAEANPRPLPLVRLNKALNDLSATEFFNVGMRNRVSSSTTESYRIISGSNADKKVLKSDSRLYHRGHLFGRAIEDGSPVTIGLSSGSKIWSNKSSKLPPLIHWCKKLARKIASDRIPVTGSGLDYLDAGEQLEALPEDIIAVDWPSSVYRNSITARIPHAQTVIVAPLVDFSILIDQAASTDEAVMVELRYNDNAYRFTFSFGTNRFFEPADQHQPVITIDSNRSSVSLIDFLNEEMLIFYTSDLSSIEGISIFRAPEEPPTPLDERAIEVVDWTVGQVNIQREFGDAGESRISIHDYLSKTLHADTANVVYYDHGTGEIADFVGFTEIEGRILVQFYHCKGATGENAGHRLSDISELTGQVIKSVTWSSKQRILNAIRRRFTNNIGSHRFIRGDLNSLEQLLTPIAPARLDFEFVAVQPGLRKEGLTNEISNMLAAANDHLIRAGYRPLRILSS